MSSQSGRKLALPSRSLLAVLTMLAPFAPACSFFAPTLSEYASGAGGSSAGIASAGSLSNSSGSAGEAGLGAGAPNGGQGAGGQAGSDTSAAGEAGAAGTLETPDPDPIQGHPVAPAETVLDSVVTIGLPVFGALTRYDVDESTAAASAEAPLFQPFDANSPAFWDNLVAEQTQARLALIALPTRGATTLDTTDMTGPGNENPRRLSAWVSALERANSGALFSALCVVDTHYLPAVASAFHGTSDGTQLDLAPASDYDHVFWARTVQPWFDTIPSSYWYTIADHPIIQWGPIDGGFKNTSGNLSKMLSAVALSFHDAYGVYPNFVVDATWFAADSSLPSNRYVIGKSPWLTPSASSDGFVSYQGLTWGTGLAGFVDPSSTPVFPRKTLDSYNNPVITLTTSLADAIENDSVVTLLQGFTDIQDSAGLYRSEASDWATPNQYLNLVRRYGDPKTSTLRLEAEGCDRYSDTTKGNSGGAFRRDGDLDVRSLTSNPGWAVTSTAAGEWIEFDDVDFSAGNYRFIAKYATNADAARIELVVDGVKLAPVILPKTVNAETFATTSLGERIMSHGPHDLRLRFLDGLVDLDWLFTRKLDPKLSLKVAAGTYVSAAYGGGGDVNVNAANAQIWEQFTFDAISAGSLGNGSQVYLQTYNGLYLIVAAGTNAVTADSRTPRAADVFTVELQSAGDLVPGANIALLSADKTHYVSVGTDNLLNASATSVGPNETFTIDFY